MKMTTRFTPLLLAALSVMPAVSAGRFLPVVNSTFSNVHIQCSAGYALQSSSGGTCTSLSYPQQAFNSAPGIGWQFSLHSVPGSSAGLTGPGTDFDPPSFSGLPFLQAASLQGAGYGVAQTIAGFAAGSTYRLSFYLGSRYASGQFDGNQTVVATMDGRLIGKWTLASFTPFLLESAVFSVATGGPHTLKFTGTTLGDHTAFLSGVSIQSVAGADEQ